MDRKVKRQLSHVEYLQAYLKTLRKKIEDDLAHPKYIVTEPWLGYRFQNPSDPLHRRKQPRSARQILTSILSSATCAAYLCPELMGARS
ncbi:MAG: hypothetical protein DMG77_19240 [Acidobacteria bacterium]|nr:MAG: hypothetical protein DMG77_19240 [Acidobacteriota bacterium]